MPDKLTSPARVVLAYKRRTVKKLNKRTPTQRLKARLYYRKNKTKLKLKRKRYLKRNNIFNKSKKLFKRSTPSWLSKKKNKAPKFHKPKFKKFKFNAPKRK
jgi:hypothetical protein